MTETEVRSDIAFLQTRLSSREAKYLRNYNRYSSNGQRRENIYEMYTSAVAYGYGFGQTDSDTGPWPIENVIKSCIDTKISKMSQVKVRPFLNPVNGKWKTRKVCRIGQQFFDEYYQRYGLYKEAIEAYRDAQIFEVGHIWLDEESLRPYRVKPWEYYVDPSELNYGCIYRVMLRFWQYPLLELKDKIKESTIAWRTMQRDIHAKAKEMHVYYDLDGGQKYTFVEEELIDQHKIDFETSPVADIYCVPPIKGMWSTSLVDDLYTLQRELDVVNQKIHDATVLTPANLALVPTIGGVKKSTLDAGREGLIYEFEPVPGVNAPVAWVNPAPVNGQLLERRQQIMDTMYNISGVSQLSAQSKKPTGLNSGVALDTLEDVESERHNFELQNYERFCMSISEIAIRVFPKDATILPSEAERAGVTWADIQKERDFYAIQFSPASALSGTPKVKMEQVEKLQKMGIVTPEEAAEFLEFPDLERVYSLASANRDDIEAITQRAAEKREFDFYEAINVQALWRNVMVEIMRLDANEPENEEIIDNLNDFQKALKLKMDTINAAKNPPQPAPAPPPQAQPVALGQPANPPVPQAQPAQAMAGPGGNGAGANAAPVAQGVGP